jgi:hypothetical protein
LRIYKDEPKRLQVCVGFHSRVRSLLIHLRISRRSAGCTANTCSINITTRTLPWHLC